MSDDRPPSAPRPRASRIGALTAVAALAMLGVSLPSSGLEPPEPAPPARCRAGGTCDGSGWHLVGGRSGGGTSAPNGRVRCQACNPPPPAQADVEAHEKAWREAAEAKGYRTATAAPSPLPGQFHAHLDVCPQCREHPHALCARGASILEHEVAPAHIDRKAAGVLVASIAGNPCPDACGTSCPYHGRRNAKLARRARAAGHV